MEIITEILNWYMMLIIKITMAAGIVVVIIMLLIFLGCFLLVRGTEYLQDKIDSFSEKPPVNNDPAPEPPASTGPAGGNQAWITGKDDYGVNMEGMNGYPGGYGDEQMFEDEEEFHGMDYGLLDDEAKDENNEQ